MKKEVFDNKIIIYLKKEIIGKMNFDDIDSLEDYFRDFFLKLKNIYNMELKGFYNVKVYIDDIYGVVLELEDEQIDYGDFYNQIEMRIIPIHVDFLYKIDNLMFIPNTELYIYKNNYYLKISNKINYKDYLLVMDYAKIVYNNTDNIIKYGKQLKHFNFSNFML